MQNLGISFGNMFTIFFTLILRNSSNFPNRVEEFGIFESLYPSQTVVLQIPMVSGFSELLQKNFYLDLFSLKLDIFHFDFEKNYGRTYCYSVWEKEEDLCKFPSYSRLFHTFLRDASGMNFILLLPSSCDVAELKKRPRNRLLRHNISWKRNHDGSFAPQIETYEAKTRW